MQRVQVNILEVRLAAPGLVGGRIECPPGLRPAAGQYLLGQALGAEAVLPAALFAARLATGEAHELELAPPLPPTWTAGTRLALRGPLGRGFSLPGMARRVALVAPNGLPHRLLPLAQAALAQGAAVALYTRGLPAGLPPEVEVAPPEALREAAGWADYLAADLPLAGLANLRRRLGLEHHARLPFSAQVLLQADLVCGGLAECGLCAVPARRGWRLACKDGPVFDLNELEDG